MDARTANDDGLAASMAEVHDIERVVLLWQHAPGEDQIGPVNIVVAQFFSVAVDQPDRPGTRQQRCHRDQAKRRRWIFGAEDLGGPLEIPERVRIESGIDQKRFARLCPQYAFPRLKPHPNFTVGGNGGQV